ncbi:MAG: alpha/beta hydrolase [Rhodocyclaceae bacterium]|nr:alpha/beta hydrolase [Rhodocyclaceae bacterium]
MTPQDTHQRVDGLAYGDHPRQCLDLYRPLGSAPAAGWPVLLFFYGGSWQSGHRSEYRFLGEALAACGILAAVADYRLHPEVRYDGVLTDSAAALAWLRGAVAQHGGDPARLFVAGHSAGAFNAAMLALDARWLGEHGLSPVTTLAGWVGVAGPYDFRPLLDPALMALFNRVDAPDTTPDDTQPIFYASADAPPALLVAPREDHIVYPGVNTGGLAQRLRMHAVPVTERYYRRTNHYTVIGALGEPLRPLAPVLEDVCEFVVCTPRPSEAHEHA